MRKLWEVPYERIHMNDLDALDHIRKHGVTIEELEEVIFNRPSDEYISYSNWSDQDARHPQAATDHPLEIYGRSETTGKRIFAVVVPLMDRSAYPVHAEKMKGRHLEKWRKYSKPAERGETI